MKRRFQIALVMAGVVATLAVSTGVIRDVGARSGGRGVVTGDRQERPRRVAGPQPDTSSPDWKSLSTDVGVLIRDDDRLGLRGRLYVRVDDVWLPVATDGAADVHHTIPVK